MENACLLDRLLETCARHGGSEVLLVPGHSPLIRIDGQLREIQTGSLDPSAVQALIASVRSQSQTRQCGSWFEALWNHYGKQFHFAFLGTENAPTMVAWPVSG